MLTRTRTYAVDRLDGRLARLVSDDGTAAEIPRRWLPTPLREGAVMRVTVRPGGPDWATAQFDEVRRKWRDAILGLMLEELRWRGSGSRIGCVAPGLGMSSF
jgi:hypothetical protein